jgi:alcohol dehydrogenase
MSGSMSTLRSAGRGLPADQDLRPDSGQPSSQRRSFPEGIDRRHEATSASTAAPLKAEAGSPGHSIATRRVQEKGSDSAGLPATSLAGVDAMSWNTEAGTAPWTAEVGTVRLYFGAGELDRLGVLARELGGTRVLVVTDPGVRAAGYADRAVRGLEGAGLAAAVFDEVEENPTTRHVERGRRAAVAHETDLLIGLGGGSAMDSAKGINFLYSNGGRMEDYQGFGRAAHPMLPSIGVPTTAGTGSDAQSYALIAREEGHVKMACGDVKARFRCVILDAELAASAPRRVMAAAGMDALSHAVESYVTTRRTPISRLFAREAWHLLEAHFERLLDNPGDLEAAGAMLLGAHLAGAAIEGSMLGAAHACANPLTAHYGIAHGAAVNLTLPHVVRFNAATAEDAYHGLADASDASALADRLTDLRAKAGLPARLRDCGVEAGGLPKLAAEAATQWTARFNPRPVTVDDLLAIYEAAF